jgi:hypothetical protein
MGMERVGVARRRRDGAESLLKRAGMDPPLSEPFDRLPPTLIIINRALQPV